MILPMASLGAAASWNRDKPFTRLPMPMPDSADPALQACVRREEKRGCTIYRVTLRSYGFVEHPSSLFSFCFRELDHLIRYRLRQSTSGDSHLFSWWLVLLRQPLQDLDHTTSLTMQGPRVRFDLTWWLFLT